VARGASRGAAARGSAAVRRPAHQAFADQEGSERPVAPRSGEIGGCNECRFRHTIMRIIQDHGAQRLAGRQRGLEGGEVAVCWTGWADLATEV